MICLWLRFKFECFIWLVCTQSSLWLKQTKCILSKAHACLDVCYDLSLVNYAIQSLATQIIAATNSRDQNGYSSYQDQEPKWFLRNSELKLFTLTASKCYWIEPNAECPQGLIQHSDSSKKRTEIESGSILYTPKKKKKNCLWPWLPQYWGPSHCVSSKSQSQLPVPSALAVEREDRWVYLWKVLYLQL